MTNPYFNNLFGNYPTRTFSEIFPSDEEFLLGWQLVPYSNVGVNEIDDDYIKLIYWLLMGQYANSHILSTDENRFKLNLFELVFMYGPSWIKRLEIQNSLRKLKEDDGSLLEGARYVSNLSLNPSTLPNNGDLAPLDTINQQSYNGWKKNKMQAYGEILEILRADVSQSFVGQFKKLFVSVVSGYYPLWFKTDKEDPTYDN